jgi:hypothetical protein
VSIQPTFTLTSATPPTHEFASLSSLCRRQSSNTIKGESIMIHLRDFRYALHADADTSTARLFSDSSVHPKTHPSPPNKDIAFTARTGIAKPRARDVEAAQGEGGICIGLCARAQRWRRQGPWP